MHTLQGEKMSLQTHSRAREEEARLGKEAISTPGSHSITVGYSRAMCRRSTSDNGDGSNYVPDSKSCLPRNSKPVHMPCRFNTQYLWSSQGQYQHARGL